MVRGNQRGGSWTSEDADKLPCKDRRDLLGRQSDQETHQFALALLPGMPGPGWHRTGNKWGDKSFGPQNRGHVTRGNGGMSSRGQRLYKARTGRAWKNKKHYGRSWGGKKSNLYKGQGYQNKEKKIFELAQNYACPVATPTCTGGDAGASGDGLFFPVQGTGERDRIGRRVIITDIQVKIFITEAENDNAPTSVIAMNKAQPSQIFIALVQDRCTNNAKYGDTTLVYADVGELTVTAQEEQCMDPMRNLKHVDRFKVLATRVVRTPLASVSEDTASNNYHISSTFTNVLPIFLKVRIPVLFSANGGAIADVVDNSFHIIAWADKVGHTPTLKVLSRFRFVE